MKSSRWSVRFSDRTLMLLDELAGITNTTKSTVIKAFVERGLDSLLDEEGNFKLNDQGDRDKGTGQ